MSDDHQSALWLYEEAMAFTYSAALRVVAQIRVADHMVDGPRTVAELAEATGTEPTGLNRVLVLLAGRGVFHRDEQGRFSLTARGAALRSDARTPARSGILMFTDEMFWKTTHRISTILTERPDSIDHVLGTSIDGYFERHPELEELFFDGIEKVSDVENPIVARAYDFPASGTVVDVGGRFGGFLLALLRERPDLRGVLFDRDPMLRRHRLDEPDIAGRWDVVDGDFYVDLPVADCYVIKRVLHVLDDEDSVRVLSTCRRAMKPDGRVLVVDAIIPPGDEPHLSKSMDFMMVANFAGKERTAAELERLFTAAGLRLDRIIPTAAPVSIAEAVIA